MFSLSSINIVNFHWITFVKDTLNDISVSEYFLQHKVDNINYFKSIVKLRLRDQFLQDWHSTVDTSSVFSVSYI